MTGSFDLSSLSTLHGTWSRVTLNSYERENAHQKKENDLLLAKVGKLLEINQDLIKAREEDLEKRGPATDEGNQNQAPKVVMQVSYGNDSKQSVFWNCKTWLRIKLLSREHQNRKRNFWKLNLQVRPLNEIWKNIRLWIWNYAKKTIFNLTRCVFFQNQKFTWGKRQMNQRFTFNLGRGIK